MVNGRRGEGEKEKCDQGRLERRRLSEMKRGGSRGTEGEADLLRGIVTAHQDQRGPVRRRMKLNKMQESIRRSDASLNTN